MHKKTISVVILPLLTLFVLLLQSCPSPTSVSPPNPKTFPDKPGEIVKDSKGRVIGTVTIEKTPKGTIISKTLEISSSLESIPDGTSGRGVLENQGLTDIDFSRASSLHTIGSRAFAKNKLTGVKIPDSVVSIGDYAFRENLLTGLTLPGSIKTIGRGAFRKNSLESTSTVPLAIPSSVKTIGDHAFRENRLIGVTLPSGVTTIGSYAFAQNRLAAVVIPSSVTRIKSGSFAGNHLNSVTIPNTVDGIEHRAFQNNLLTSVTIPASVSKGIADWAFYGNRLTSVTLLAATGLVSQQAFGSNPLTNGVTLSQTVLDGSDPNAFPAGTSFKNHAGVAITRGGT